MRVMNFGVSFRDNLGVITRVATVGDDEHIRNAVDGVSPSSRDASWGDKCVDLWRQAKTDYENKAWKHITILNGDSENECIIMLSTINNNKVKWWVELSIDPDKENACDVLYSLLEK